jgi:hypothetical protein
MNKRFYWMLLGVTMFLVAPSRLHADERTDTGVSSKLYPVDEAYKNPSFAEFREELKRAIARRDTAFLLRCISDEILLAPSRGPLRRSSIKTAIRGLNADTIQAEKGFAYLDYLDYGRGGKRLFISEWIDYRPPTPEPTILSIPIWARLGAILSLGGTFADDKLTVFRAPYVWSRWPSDTDYDYAVIGDYVMMKPIKYYGEVDSCDTLSYDLVYKVDFAVTIGGAPDPWERVRTADGRTGYVLRSQLRSPYDFGAEFTFSGGTWWLSRFSQYP